MRGTVGETLERLVLLQVGAAAATRERVEQAVEDLVQRGRVEREEGRRVVDDVMDRARERSSGARSLIDASVQQGLRRGGVPTREDYEDLVFRVEQLEHRVRMIEDRPAAPPPSVIPPSAGGPEDIMSPPGGVPGGAPGGVPGGPASPVIPPSTATPPRDEPDVPPGL